MHWIQHWVPLLIATQAVSRLLPILDDSQCSYLPRRIGCFPSSTAGLHRMISAEVLHRLAETLEGRKAAETWFILRCQPVPQRAGRNPEKIGEEATETVMASKDNDRLHLVREVADLWFHSMVLLSGTALADDVLAELHRREAFPASTKSLPPPLTGSLLMSDCIFCKIAAGQIPSNKGL